MSLLNDSAKALYSPYQHQGTVQYHHNSEVNQAFGIADPVELPSEPFHETYEPTYRTPVPPGHALNSDGYIIPTSQVVTNPRQQYGARSLITPVQNYGTNNRPMGNPNYAMNSPPAGNTNFPMNSPPAGNPNFPMNRPPVGSPNNGINSPPANFVMNRPPTGNLNFAMNNPPAGNPNGMNSPPGGIPNNGMNNPNYAVNNRLAYPNPRNVAIMPPFQVGGTPYHGRAPPGYMSHRAPNNFRNNQPPQMNPSFAARIPYYGAGNPRNYGADIPATSMNIKNINSPNNGGLPPPPSYQIALSIGSNPIPYEAMMPQKPPGYSANNPFKYGDRRRGSSFIPSPPVMKTPTAVWG
ncbi:hypothetical protein SNE40_008717 [Patella caerulea]